MPNDGWPYSERRRLRRQLLNRSLAARRERPPRVDIWTDGVAVVDEDEIHGRSGRGTTCAIRLFTSKNPDL